MNDSILLPQCDLIDDRLAKELARVTHVDGEPVGRGLLPRDYTADPLYGLAQRFDLPLLDARQRREIVEQREAAGVTNRQLKAKFNIASLHQGSTNYCWFNAVVTAMHYLQVQQTGSHVRLSPASGAAPIKGFQNVGGWGTQALKWVTTNGVNTIEEWPANAIDRRYFTESNRALARTRIVTEWYDLKPRHYGEMATCLALGIPVPIGLNWWRHEVCAIDLAYEGGVEIVIVDNSWGTRWGDNGLGKLSVSRATPDDACAPLVQHRFHADSQKATHAQAL